MRDSAEILAGAPGSVTSGKEPHHQHHGWLGAFTRQECSLFFALDTDFIRRSSLFCGSDASNQGYLQYIWIFGNAESSSSSV